MLCGVVSLSSYNSSFSFYLLFVTMTAYISDCSLKGTNVCTSAYVSDFKRVYQFQKYQSLVSKTIALSACSKNGGEEIVLVRQAKYTVPMFLVFVGWWLSHSDVFWILVIYFVEDRISVVACFSCTQMINLCVVVRLTLLYEIECWPVKNSNV